MWNKIVLVLFICKSSQVLGIGDCESLRNCQRCIHAPSCGWYLQYRSINESGCFHKQNIENGKSDPKNGYTFPPQASFYIISNKNKTVISPQEVSLNLRINEPFTFPITFTPLQEHWGKRTVELKYRTRRPRIIKLNFFSNCSGQHTELIETNKCDVEFGKPVEFHVKVVQLSCSKRQPERIKTIEINPSPGAAIFRLNVYAYCYCPCEMEGRRGNPEPPEVIPDCHGRGSFVCGVCYCKDGYAGENCEINLTNTIS